jgi:lambda family phage portal protein
MFARWFRRGPSALQAAREKAEIERALLDALVTEKRREALERAFDAAKPSQYWQRPGDLKSANAVMDHARTTVRSWARYLDENHDLAIGVLDDVEKKVIGCGIQVSPKVLGRDGKPAKEANERLAALWREWTLNTPESTRTLPWVKVEQLVCRSWMRDGEVLIQHLEGRAPIQHRARVPYSIEPIEADFLPFDLIRDTTPTQNRIVHGVELTDWREPVAYWLYKEHPGNVGINGITGGRSPIYPDVKRVSADQITHIKHVRRFDQVRGVSVLVGVLQRLEDIKDYEESERIAARVAAAMCAVITKSTDFGGGAVNTDDVGTRLMEMNPGQIFDQLLPGEKVEMIGSDRPNTNLGNFRGDQLRAVSAGTGTSASSVSRNYNGTYSSQRQELVETWVGYEQAREYLYGAFYRPVWQRFARMAYAAGLVPRTNVDPMTMLDVDFIGPAMPWINPVDEVDAQAKAVEAGFKSRHMVIRETQLDPSLVDAEIEGDPLRDKLAPAKPAEPPPKPKAVEAA